MIEIKRSKILAVEGQDEIKFFDALLRKLNIDDIQLLDFEGKSNFNIKIKSIVNIPGFKKVRHFGLIRDADTNPPNSAFDSIKNALEKANLPFPTTINTFTRTNPSTGIFVMPGHASSGMLEDLCLSSLKNSKIISCIEAFQNCFDEPSKTPSKSLVQCYLASKNPITNNLGLGAQKGHWDFTSSVFDEIKSFLLQMN